MRQMSARRRRLVALASSVAAISGVGPALFRQHPLVMRVWLGSMVAALIWVIVLMARLRRDEGCS